MNFEYKYFEIEGLECAILKFSTTFSNHLCGYVRIPGGHPLWSLDYNCDEFPNLEVHGGITFSGSLEGTGSWIGFDCAHSGDARFPGDDEYGNVYRDEEYVRGQLKKLVSQVRRVQATTHISVSYHIAEE